MLVIKGGVLFLHGYGGTIKMYMWRRIASSLRSKHDIVLIVATSGIISILLSEVEPDILSSKYLSQHWKIQLARLIMMKIMHNFVGKQS